MWKWPPVVSGGDKSVANLVSSSAQAPLPAPLIQAVSPAACPLTTLLAHLAVINDYSRWEYSDSGWQTPCIQIIALFSQITLQSANHLIGTATKESFLCVGVPNLQPHAAWIPIPRTCVDLHRRTDVETCTQLINTVYLDIETWLTCSAVNNLSLLYLFVNLLS